MWKPVLFLFAALPVFAQWPDLPGKGVPMKNGKPDLEAPAPKTAWGKTDFSGLWENIRPALKGDPPTAAFANIGANLPGGLPFKPLAAELVRERVADHSKNNPDARCLPMGIMQYNTHSQPRKIIQTPELLLIIYEPNAGLRQIFLDGRKAPPADVEPWWFGYSVGHWEGDELVVETTHLRDVGWLDIQGSPITSNGKITERFRRTSYGRLDVIATIEDSDVYTAPFTVAMRQRIMPGAELIEFVCGENDRFTSYLDQAEKAAPGTK
jgi:hypothetical protein